MDVLLDWRRSGRGSDEAPAGAPERGPRLRRGAPRRDAGARLRTLLLAVTLEASLTVTLKVQLPADEVMPRISPVAELRLSPGGRPDVIVQL